MHCMLCGRKTIAICRSLATPQSFVPCVNLQVLLLAFANKSTQLTSFPTSCSCAKILFLVTFLNLAYIYIWQHPFHSWQAVRDIDEEMVEVLVDQLSQPSPNPSAVREELAHYTTEEGQSIFHFAAYHQSVVITDYLVKFLKGKSESSKGLSS